MSDYIQDGTGTGHRVKVDSVNRLRTFATTETGGTEAARKGDNFNANSGNITLTSSNKSALLYMKNTDGFDWIINRVFYNTGNSTGGSGDFFVDVIANPTAGTLISAGTVHPVYNLNFGSPKDLDAISLVGVEGSTLTDGEVRVSTILSSSGGRVLIGFDSVIVPPGSSIAVAITPQVGNTSMVAQVGFNIYKAGS